jgi:hypothetical protein
MEQQQQLITIIITIIITTIIIIIILIIIITIIMNDVMQWSACMFLSVWMCLSALSVCDGMTECLYVLSVWLKPSQAFSVQPGVLALFVPVSSLECWHCLCPAWCAGMLTKPVCFLFYVGVPVFPFCL